MKATIYSDGEDWPIMSAFYVGMLVDNREPNKYCLKLPLVPDARGFTVYRLKQFGLKVDAKDYSVVSAPSPYV